MSAAEIALALGEARREGHSWRCRCPLHGGRSLTVRDGEGRRLLVWCFGGCDTRDVLAELRRTGLLSGHAQYRPRGGQAPLRDDCKNEERIERALRIWDAAEDAHTGPVAQYLASRGIVLDPWPAPLRYHPQCPHPHGAPMPAMIALVEHVARGIVGVHRTYLTGDSRRCDRASLGPIAGGAVRLGMPRATQWLAVGEGIETALSVAAVCSIPAWAALSAGGMKNLVLPSQATHVIICADHDVSGIGERAAHHAAERWLAQGRRVRLAMPPTPGTDFNNVLTDCAQAKINEARHVA